MKLSAFEQSPSKIVGSTPMGFLSGWATACAFPPVEMDVCMASPRLDSLTLRGSVELAQTLLKGHLMLQDNYGLYTDIENTC